MSILLSGDFFSSGDRCPSIEHRALGNAVKTADAFICNLEGPMANTKLRGIQKVGPVIIQGKNVVKTIKSLGVTSVCLANNHIMDGGVLGLESTIELLKKYKIDYFGINCNQKDLAKKLTRIDVEGIPVSVINVAEEEFNGVSAFGIGAFVVDQIDIWRLNRTEIEAGRKTIMVLHGGIEQEHLPPPWLRKFCRWLIDIGFSAVVTHHPHVSGCVESYKGKPIAWSLGNFWFSNYGGTFYNRVGYVFEISFSDNGLIKWQLFPYYSDYNKGVIRSMTQDEQKKWQTLVTKTTETLNSNDHYQSWWNNLLEKKKAGYINKYSLAPWPKLIKILYHKFFKPAKTFRQWKLRQLNGIRCKSHREIWIGALMDDYKN